jgi:hypothetical protein
MMMEESQFEPTPLNRALKKITAIENLIEGG